MPFAKSQQGGQYVYQAPGMPTILLSNTNISNVAATSNQLLDVLNYGVANSPTLLNDLRAAQAQGLQVEFVFYNTPAQRRAYYASINKTAVGDPPTMEIVDMTGTVGLRRPRDGKVVILVNAARFPSDLTIGKIGFLSSMGHELAHDTIIGALSHKWDSIFTPGANGRPEKWQDVYDDKAFTEGFKIYDDLKFAAPGPNSVQYVTKKNGGGRAIGATYTAGGVSYKVVSDQDYYEAWSKSVYNYFKFHVKGKKVSAESMNFDPGEVYLSDGTKINPITAGQVANIKAGGDIGSLVGTSLGNYLAKGNAIAGVLYGSILGEAFQRVGLGLVGSIYGNKDGASVAVDAFAGSFGNDIYNNLKNSAASAVSSAVTLELGNAIGLTGFGSEVFGTVGSSFITRVANNFRTMGAGQVWNGFSSKDFFSGQVKVYGKDGSVLKNPDGSEVTAKGAGFAMANALGAYFGSKLGSLVVQPQTQAAVVLSSIGSSVGVYFAMQALGNSTSLLLNFVLPGIGSFVGFVVGALIGNLFGGKKPRVPSASAETALQLPFARYEIGAVTSANGGNTALVTTMAANARDILNTLIAEITRGAPNASVSNVNGIATTQSYGYTGSQLYVKVNGVTRNVASADDAVDYGTLTAIKNTKVVGGDIFIKRAILNTTSQDIASLSGDMFVSKDYEFYAHNRNLINGYIKDGYTTTTTSASAVVTDMDKGFYTGTNKTLVDKIASTGVPSLLSSESATYLGNQAQFDRLVGAVNAQAIANPWIVTLLRSAELKLDQFATSDFYGGLGGFLSSLGVNNGSGSYFEDSSFRTRWNNAAGAIISVRTSGSTAGVFDVLPQALAGPDGNDLKDGRFKHLNAVGTTPALWNVATNATTAWSSNVNMQDWSGTGNDVFWSHMAGVTTNEVVDQYGDLITSQAGVVYETSVYAAQHRGRAELYVQYLGENKNHLAWALMGGAARESGAYQGDINNFNVLSGTSVAPAGTAYRRVMLRLISNGGNEPYAFFTRPMTREVVAGAVTPNWEDTGHSVYIDQMAQVGYSTTGTITSGNDVIDKSGSTTAVTIDDTYTWQVWVPQQSYYNGPNNPPVVIPGHYENATVTGGDDIFLGGQGNDTLYGRAGWDWLDGGAGNDTIYGGDNNDIIIGGAGNDNLYGEAGDDYLAAVSGNDVLRGGDGNDTLVGAGGGDSMIGGNGNDTLLLAQDQSFNWYMGGSDFNFTDDATSNDTISAERFTVGVRYDLDLRPADWNSNADPSIANPASRLAEVYNNATNQWLTSNGLINIESGTGSQYDDQIFGTVGANTLKGLDGKDILDGRAGNDIIEGGKDADSLFGGGGSDTLSYEGSLQGVFVNLSTGEAYGGDADGDTWNSFENVRGSRASDQLKGDGAQNTIEGLAGDDWIIATGGGNVTQTYAYSYNPYYDEPIQYPTGWTGGDIYNGGIGLDTVDYSDATSGVTAYLGSYTETSASAGSGSTGMAQGHTYINIERIVGSGFGDSLSAGSGAQTLFGGKGNDNLAGGVGSDTYILERNDGSDTISDTNADNNILILASDVHFSDMYISSSGGSGGFLDVGIRGTADKVRVNSNFATLTNNILKTVAVNDGAALDISKITFQTGGGTDGNDTVNGSSSNYDWIFAFNGNDVVTGSGTAWEDKGNVIVAGLGDDTIRTSVGDDQFAYDRGDGFDNITDAGGEDTIVFGATVTPDDVIYQVVGNDLFIGLKDKNEPSTVASAVVDKIRVVNGGVVTSGVLNTIEFVLAGGTSIDLRKLNIAWTGGAGWNYSNVAPIALDLDGDGLNLSTVDDSEVIVKTAAGGLSKVGWVGPTDGFLAVDRDGDGKINKLSEISFTQDKEGATSDLEGLKTWDTNGDGLLNSSDTNFNKILLWVDANQNGRSTTRELRTLTQAGIAAIDLKGVATGYTADMGIDSFVQNNMKFIWADGSQGNAYDVSLARRVLGSEGLYAGDYQAEWGASNSDGTMGRLLNDPKTAAKAARIAAKKGLLDKIGASYQEVKAKAQVDFSDTDVVDAKVAKRWAKMDKSAQAAWLSGQVIQTDASVVAVSAQRALQTTSEVAQQATSDLKNAAYSHAGASVSDGLGLDATGNGTGTSNGSTANSQGASELGTLSVTASAPDLSVAGYAGASATSQTQAWWRSETQNDSAYRSQNLSNLLSAMETTTPDQGWGQPSDDAMAQQQLLLRQSMAAFGGTSGGSPAVWNRDASGPTPLAASTGLQAHAQSSFASAVA